MVIYARQGFLVMHAMPRFIGTKPGIGWEDVVNWAEYEDHGRE